MAEQAATYDIHCKAMLYGIALFLSPFADKIIPILFQDKWPSLPMVAGCTLLGVIACSIGLRAYYDGSYERSKNGNDNGNGNGTPKVITPAATSDPTDK